MRRIALMRRPLMQGVGRVLILMPDSQDRLERIHPFASDQQALQRDLWAIGNDFWTVIRRERPAQH